MNRRLLAFTTLLAFLVIGLGAYVRLSDAGLGCPDWPGCYGHYVGVPDSEPEKLAAASAFPQRPVHTGKAWKEMVHRYLAGSLGLLIAWLAVRSWLGRPNRPSGRLLPTLLLAVVAVQGALGMWTVTLLLKPVIVTLHLLGGMITFALLVTLLVRSGRPDRHRDRPLASLRFLALLTLLAVLGQIALGGWVSSNYAALACTGFPECGNSQAGMDFSHAFRFFRELGYTEDGQLLPVDALTAIHWTHRIGAVFILLLAGALAIFLRRQRDPRWRFWGSALGLILAVQISLGVANVLLALPLPIAVMHNLGAALLLATLVSINVLVRKPSAAF